MEHSSSSHSRQSRQNSQGVNRRQRLQGAIGGAAIAGLSSSEAGAETVTSPSATSMTRCCKERLKDLNQMIMWNATTIIRIFEQKPIPLLKEIKA